MNNDAQEQGFITIVINSDFLIFVIRFLIDLNYFVVVEIMLSQFISDLRKNNNEDIFLVGGFTFF